MLRFGCGDKLRLDRSLSWMSWSRSRLRYLCKRSMVFNVNGHTVCLTKPVELVNQTEKCANRTGDYSATITPTALATVVFQLNC